MRPSIIVDKWGIKTNSLLGYAVTTDDFYVSREFSYTRAGTTPGTLINASGNLVNAVLNTPRIDYTGGSPSLLVEPAATNQIRNNSMVGAVAGSPGTMPTNWAESLNGLVRQSVALGTENGVSYIDIRYSGTATGGSCAVLFETATQIVASTGQTWSNSVYLKIIAQPNPPVAYRLGMWEYNTSGTVFGGSFATAVVPTTTSLQRFTQTRALTGATTDRVRPLFDVSMTSGQSYDFTIRIGYPQMEQSSFATSVITTTTASLTRDADVCTFSNASSLIGQTEGTVYIEFNMQTLGVEGYAIRLVAASFDNSVHIRRSTANLVTLELRAAGSSVFSQTLAATGFVKAAIAYKSGDIAAFVNGTQAGSTSTSAFTFGASFTAVNLGTFGAAAFLNDRIRAAAIYTTRLSDAQLIDMTWQ